MALVQRKLRATITLAAISGQAQTFANSGGADTVVIEGLRMSANILHAGGVSDGTLDLTVYGLAKSTMNRLSTLGMRLNLVPKNQIILEAGDDAGMSTVFVGYILIALADFNAQPNVAFHISAHTLAAQAADTAPATSFQGYADVATIMSGFAALMGLKFENNGVTGRLFNPYYDGSARNQARQCVQDAGISWNAGEGGILAIWPKFGSRNGAVPLIAPPPQGGMAGYPTFSALGIDFRTLYDPSIGFGQKVQVQSSLEAACGTYVVYGLQHELECEMPDGKWFSTINGYASKFNLGAPS
jgi:hypothetical protein